MNDAWSRDAELDERFARFMSTDVETAPPPKPPFRLRASDVGAALLAVVLLQVLVMLLVHAG